MSSWLSSDKRPPRPFVTITVLWSLLGLCVSTAANVPRWQPHDFAFTSKAKPQNPFMSTFSATVKGPDGKEFTTPGFFDGSGVWKVRLAPFTEGKWSIVTKSDIADLNGQRADLNCVANSNPRVHGPLRVDKQHPHHFVFEDGTRFYLQGYEYDWLWALDTGKNGVPTIKQSLDLILNHGFNYVILNAYAHDTSWRKGKTGPDDFGPPPLYAWEGSNQQPDHTRMNLSYWQHYDQVIEALHQRGMQAHLFIKVYNKQVKWPNRNSPEEDLYFRWLIARYAAYPNVIWDFSKESYNEKDKEYLKNRLQFIRANDPYRRLLTVHDDDVPYDSGQYDALLDFHTDQAHKEIHNTIVKQWQRKAWPVANVETAYEQGSGGPEDKTYKIAHTPEETLRQAWEVVMGGGYMAYYYTYTAWDVVRPLDVPPGYAYFKHFGDFWRATEYWKLEPSDKLVTQGWCLANPGREYIVFQIPPKPFVLDINGSAVPLKAEWFNPQTGKRTSAGLLGNGTANLTPPADWGNAPAVLHVTPK
jgi:hypothetical protein